MLLFALATWEANNLHGRACIRVLPHQTSQGKKKTKRSFFPTPLRQHHTSPHTPSTQFIFLPIKVSPPAWLWETQFMLRALGILFLAGTEKSSQPRGGSGSRTSRSLVSGRQRRAGTGSPRADRKSAAPPPRPPRATAGPSGQGTGPWEGWELRRCRGRGGKGVDLELEPHVGVWPWLEQGAPPEHPGITAPMGLHAMGQAHTTPRHGATLCQLGTACHGCKIGGFKGWWEEGKTLGFVPTSTLPAPWGPSSSVP